MSTESIADEAADNLSGKRIRGLPAKQRQHVRVVDADDAIADIARSEGEITALPPLAAAPKS